MKVKSKGVKVKTGKCEYCKGYFKKGDDIILTDDGFMHEEDCFMEYCYEQFRVHYTFEEYQERLEKLEENK